VTRSERSKLALIIGVVSIGMGLWGVKTPGRPFSRIAPMVGALQGFHRADWTMVDVGMIGIGVLALIVGYVWARPES